MVFAKDPSSVVYYPPERLRTVDMNREHANLCPAAVIGMESRHVMVRCPFDMHIGFARDGKGNPVLRNLLGRKNLIRPGKLTSFLSLTNELK